MTVVACNEDSDLEGGAGCVGNLAGDLAGDQREVAVDPDRRLCAGDDHGLGICGRGGVAVPLLAVGLMWVVERDLVVAGNEASGSVAAVLAGLRGLDEGTTRVGDRDTHGREWLAVAIEDVTRNRAVVDRHGSLSAGCEIDGASVCHGGCTVEPLRLVAGVVRVALVGGAGDFDGIAASWETFDGPLACAVGIGALVSGRPEGCDGRGGDGAEIVVHQSRQRCAGLERCVDTGRVVFISYLQPCGVLLCGRTLVPLGCVGLVDVNESGVFEFDRVSACWREQLVSAVRVSLRPVREGSVEEYVYAGNRVAVAVGDRAGDAAPSDESGVDVLWLVAVADRDRIGSRCVWPVVEPLRHVLGRLGGRELELVISVGQSRDGVVAAVVGCRGIDVQVAARRCTRGSFGLHCDARRGRASVVGEMSGDAAGGCQGRVDTRARVAECDADALQSLLLIAGGRHDKVVGSGR